MNEQPFPDSVEHARRFALDWIDRSEHHAARRMRELGIPESRIGATDIIPWLGGWANREAEEFALRLHDQTGCLIADVNHCRVIDPGQLEGLAKSQVVGG